MSQRFLNRSLFQLVPRVFAKWAPTGREDDSPQILAATAIAARKGLCVPLVYNTGGYDSLETLALLDGVVDIYMPDFKFQDAEVAYKYTKEAEEYPQAAAAAIKEMFAGGFEEQ